VVRNASPQANTQIIQMDVARSVTILVEAAQARGCTIARLVQTSHFSFRLMVAAQLNAYFLVSLKIAVVNDVSLVMQPVLLVRTTPAIAYCVQIVLIF